MKEKEKIQELNKLVLRDLQLENNDSLELSGGFEEFRSSLISVVSYLLDKDFNRLLNALYRIDVSEAKVREVMTGSSISIAEQLSDLIIERQLKKIEFRRKYRFGN